MIYSVGSIWRTPENSILKVVNYDPNNCIVMVQYKDTVSKEITVTAFMTDGAFVKSWRPYLETARTIKSRLELVMEKLDG